MSLNNKSALSIRFLGVGSGVGPLGCSSCVLEQGGSPMLLIDCGPGTLEAFVNVYGCLPQALFITHLHMDHIGDLEPLFYRACFSQPSTTVRLFIAHQLVSNLQERIANYPGMVAEGGINFWDIIRLVPVSQGFWLDNRWFELHAVRHHRPHIAFGLQLPGKFFYTGDTRPIPEILHHCCSHDEIVFHDARVAGNPSHSGIGDLMSEYRQDILERLMIYHYVQEEHHEVIQQLGLRAVKKGEVIPLSPASGHSAGQADLHAVG